jgi:hypothetical protein
MIMAGSIRIPVGRRTSETLDEFKSLTFDHAAPSGYVLSGLEIHTRLQVTTNPNPATTRFHKAINKVRTDNETENVLDIRNSKALPMACLISQAMKESHYYNRTPRSANVCRNPVVAAQNVTYYGTYKIFAPLPGKFFKTTVEIAALKTQFPGITDVEMDVAVVAVFDELTDGNNERYKIIADHVNATQKSFTGAVAGAFWSGNELNGSSGANTAVLGGSLGGSLLSVMEDDFNDQLRGLGADGSAAPTSKSVKDPATNANSYGAMATKLVSPGVIALSMKSAQNIGFFVVYSRGVADAS